MTADPALVAALSQDGAWMFGAIRFELPGTTLRLLDGSGVVTVGAEQYSGSDDTFGAIAAVDAVSEDMGDEAPELRFLFHPADTAAATALANPAMQGSPVAAMIGAVNPATGLAIGAPEVIFLGEVDVATLSLSAASRELQFSVVSVFERLFEVDEGERASDGFHQSIWPGELGFSGVTGTTQKLFWGGKPPALTSGSTGSFGGFDKYNRLTSQ